MNQNFISIRENSAVRVHQPLVKIWSARVGSFWKTKVWTRKAKQTFTEQLVQCMVHRELGLGVDPRLVEQSLKLVPPDLVTRVSESFKACTSQLKIQERCLITVALCRMLAQNQYVDLVLQTLKKSESVTLVPFVGFNLRKYRPQCQLMFTDRLEFLQTVDKRTLVYISWNKKGSELPNKADYFDLGAKTVVVYSVFLGLTTEYDVHKVQELCDSDSEHFDTLDSDSEYFDAVDSLEVTKQSLPERDFW